MKIVCVGDCGVDRYLPSGNLLAGGITANFTRQARRCFKSTDKVHIISLIGNDKEAAQTAMNAVNIAGINCHINAYEGRTPVQYIEIHKNGEKNFTRYDPGILEHFYLDKNQTEILQSADLVMTPVYWQIKNVFDAVLASPISGKLAVDFSDFATDPDFDLLEKNIGKIDIAFFGLNNNQTDLIERIAAIAKNKLLIITLGEHGSLAFYQGEKIHRPANKVKSIADTTGAGDAFAAGFLSSYMHEKSIEMALKKGADNAAHTIAHLGSVPPD